MNLNKPYRKTNCGIMILGYFTYCINTNLKEKSYSLLMKIVWLNACQFFFTKNNIIIFGCSRYRSPKGGPTKF